MSEGHVHHYHEVPSVAARGGYMKPGADGHTDKQRIYTMLFCPQCGDTLEIVACDLRPHVPDEPGEAMH